MSSADRYQTTPFTFKFTAAAISSGDITIPVYTSLTVVVYSGGIAAGGTTQLVFNANTGANYNMTSVTSSPPVATSNVSQAAFIFTPSLTTTPFISVLKITNHLSVSKKIVFRTWYQGANAATLIDSSMGAGEWVNTTAQISQLRLQASASTLAAGSGFMVYGGEGL